MTTSHCINCPICGEQSIWEISIGPEHLDVGELESKECKCEWSALVLSLLRQLVEALAEPYHIELLQECYHEH